MASKAPNQEAPVEAIDQDRQVCVAVGPAGLKGPTSTFTTQTIRLSKVPWFLGKPTDVLLSFFAYHQYIAYRDVLTSPLLRPPYMASHQGIGHASKMPFDAFSVPWHSLANAKPQPQQMPGYFYQQMPGGYTNK